MVYFQIRRFSWTELAQKGNLLRWTGMKHDDYANFPCFEDGANCQEEDFSPDVNNMAVEYVDPSVNGIPFGKVHASKEAGRQ